MRRLAIFCVIGVISGCATAPPENPWDGLTVDTDPAVTSLDCGRFPAPSEATSSMIVYDMAGTNALEAYRICSETNGAVVDWHAAQIGELKVARAALVDAGQAQRNIAGMRQEMLEDERQHHFWTSLGQWALIIGLGLAL